MVRLLTMKTAWLMDTVGNKHARVEIAAIKVAAPQVALKIIDRAIQVHGGGGVSDDFPLAAMYAHQRTLRLADGPDEVHKRTIARTELRRFEAEGTATGDSRPLPLRAPTLPDRPAARRGLTMAMDSGRAAETRRRRAAGAGIAPGRRWSRRRGRCSSATASSTPGSPTSPRRPGSPRAPSTPTSTARRRSSGRSSKRCRRTGCIRGCASGSATMTPSP